MLVGSVGCWCRLLATRRHSHMRGINSTEKCRMDEESSAARLNTRVFLLQFVVEAGVIGQFGRLRDRFGGKSPLIDDQRLG